MPKTPPPVALTLKKLTVSILALLGLAVGLSLSAWAAPSARQGQGAKALVPAVADKLTPAEPGQVTLRGLLGRHVESVTNRLLKGQLEAYLQPFEKPFDTNSWRAEHIGKWLETACNTMSYSKEPRLRETVDGVVRRLLACQQPDGWLGSYAPPYRFHKYDWAANVGKTYVPFYDGPFYDVWCHYLTMSGLIRYYETSGNPQALQAAQKIADLFIATFGPAKQDLMLINHDHGFGPGVGILPVSKLFLLTGEVRYREFCRYILAQYGRKGKVPILLAGLAQGQYPFPEWAQIKHCEFELCLLGMSQLHRATGQPEPFGACRNLYEGYFAPLNPQLCVHGFKNPPAGLRVPDTYYGFLETCDIVPMLRWYMEMARITGQAHYLDALEWNLYNALLSRDLPDGRVWPGVDVPQSDYFHCCYSMLAVGLSCIPSWLYCATPQGLLVNLYEPSSFTGRVGGVNLRLEQTTQYPLDGAIQLRLEPEKPVTFELQLRIPQWCKHARLSVNGKAQPEGALGPGTFATLKRRWSSADSVELVLDMPAQICQHRAAGKDCGPLVCVARGPLLLALTARLNPGLPLDSVSLPFEADETLPVVASSPLQATETSTMSFRATGISRAKAGAKLPLLLVPYAYAGVSDKPLPAPKEGVFNVYSEDGVGPAVRVEFPSPLTQRP